MTDKTKFIEQMERRFAEEMENAKRMERPYYRVSGARDAVARVA